MQKAKPKSNDEKYKLVLECRQSGLTDHQWCLENDIRPGTFYGWVRNLRKLGTYSIPSASKWPYPTTSSKQEVVQVEIIPDNKDLLNPSSDSMRASDLHVENCIVAELSIGKASLKISNNISIELLNQIIFKLGGI